MYIYTISFISFIICKWFTRSYNWIIEYFIQIDYTPISESKSHVCRHTHTHRYTYIHSWIVWMPISKSCSSWMQHLEISEEFNNLLLLLVLLLILYFYWNPKACVFLFVYAIFTLRVVRMEIGLNDRSYYIQQMRLNWKQGNRGDTNVYNGQLWVVMLRRQSSCMPKCTWRFIGTTNRADA